VLRASNHTCALIEKHVPPPMHQCAWSHPLALFMIFLLLLLLLLQVPQAGPLVVQVLTLGNRTWPTCVPTWRGRGSGGTSSSRGRRAWVGHLAGQWVGHHLARRSWVGHLAGQWAGHLGVSHAVGWGEGG
jgi:hypothetical protein